MSQGKPSGTIQLADVSDFTKQIHAAADENDLEKDFREDFEETLSDVLDELGIGFDGVMEKAVELDSDTEIRTSTRRADMMFGRVITEYKRPNRLASESEFDDAVEQAEDYMEGACHRKRHVRNSRVWRLCLQTPKPYKTSLRSTSS